MSDGGQGQLAIRCADRPANRATQVPPAGAPVAAKGNYARERATGPPFYFRKI